MFVDRLKTETGKFEPTPYQTEEDIIKKYKEKFEKELREEGHSGEVEVTLVPVPPRTFEGTPLPDKHKRFYVFARVKKE